MTSRLDTSVGDRRRSRSYLREFLPGIGAYVVVLAASSALAPSSGGWRWLWAALPVLPVAWIAVAVGRHLRRADEYQRLRLLEGLSIGFVTAMLTAVALGLIAPALPGSAWWIYSAGMAAWLVTAIVQRLR